MMTKTAEWLRGNTRLAEWGHGDTLEGQMMRRALEDLSRRIAGLRERAMGNKLDEVLPRWRGEVRRAILMLPPLERLGRLSMSELRDLEGRVDDIASRMRRYDSKRFWEAAGDANPPKP